MARCQCAGSSCSCLIVGGPGVQVSGVGTANQPYMIQSVPTAYDVTLDASSPPYIINSPTQSKVGSRAIFMVEVEDGEDATIFLPTGTSASPHPVRGAVIDIFVTGTVGSSNIAFSGEVITWYGPAPTTTTLGWYQFIWNGRTFSGTWTPFRS